MVRLKPVSVGSLKKRIPKARKLKKRIKAGIAAGTLSAGILLPGLFGSPAELLNSNQEVIHNRPAVVQMADMDVEAEEEREKEAHEELQPENGIAARLKAWILRLPVAVRALVGVPLWVIGWLLTGLLDPVLHQVGGFILPFLIKLAVLFVVLFLVVFLTAKALHPDMPAKKILKKIFRKKNILYLVTGTVVLSILDTVFLFVLEDYEIWRRLIILIAGLIILFLLLRPFIAKAIKKRHLDADNKKLKLPI